MYRGSRSSNYGASSTASANAALGRLSAPSFSSITMLSKGGTRGASGGSNWDSHGYGGGGGGGSGMNQPWTQGGNQNMGGGGRQMEPYNTCVYLDMDNAPHDFDAVTRVIGEKGENLDYIRKTTGGQIQLQGRGTGITNNKGLHIYIEHNQMHGLERAEKLAGDLVKVVQEEFMQWQEEMKVPRMGGSGGTFNNQVNQRNQSNRGMYNDSGRGDFANQGFQDRQQEMGYNDGSRGGAYQENQHGRDSGIGGGYPGNQGTGNFSGGRMNEARNGEQGSYSADRGARGQAGGSGYNQGSNWRGNDQQDRRGQDWSDTQGRRDGASNYNRGSGQSEVRDSNQGGRDIHGQNRMDSSGNWGRQDNFGRDQDAQRQGSQDNMSMNRNNQGRFNESSNSSRNMSGVDRGMDRTTDNRGMDRNVDNRGMDRNVDNRGMGRNIENRGMDRNMENKGMDRNVDNRGMDRNMENRGMARNVDNRGMDRNMENRGIDRNMENKGIDRNMDNRGIDRNVDNRGMDRNMDNRGMDRNMDNRGMNRNQDNRGMNRNQDNRGMNRNQDSRGMDRNMDNRGMDKRGMDRGDGGMERGMDRRMDTMPRQSQPKHCDICDAKFPNDEEYQVHCNGVYHAQQVLEMKNRSQRGGNVGVPNAQPGGAGRRGENQGNRTSTQVTPETWYPNRDGTFEQRWVFNQVEPMFERQLEADILKKLQEHCRNTNEDLLPDRTQQHASNYCKLCRSPFDLLEPHINSHYHITQYVLRQLQMGVNDFVTYYGDVPVADLNTNGGRILALEALTWGPCLPDNSKPQLQERFKKLVVLSGPHLGFKCQLCKARCRNMNCWVDHVTSQKHVKRIVRAVCALRRDGFSREFPDIPICPPYFSAGCVMKLPGLRWHPEVQVPGNVLRAEPKSFMNDRDWSDSGQGGSGQVGYGGNRPMVEQQPGMNMSQGDQGGPRQQRDVPRDGGPRGGGAGPRGPDGPRDGPAGPRGGPGGQRGGDGRSGPRPLMDEPMGGGPNGPDMRGSNQPGPMAQRPGPQRQLGPKPLMGMETATSLENLGPADQELVVQVAQITGLSDVTLVVSALEALRALDPNMIQTLGALNTEAMSDLDPSMVQTLLDAIGGGAQEGPRTPASGPRGPMGHGPQDKRRMPMGKSGGPPKKMRF